MECDGRLSISFGQEERGLGLFCKGELHDNYRVVRFSYQSVLNPLWEVKK